jgi:O-acetylhomoserine/O-acetylserine sulfhydrylase-like pyridoxal-dependent enzyme
MSMRHSQDYSIETLAVRAGQERSQFNEHSEALYLTSSFVFTSAAQAAARFFRGGRGQCVLALHQSDSYRLSGSSGRA